MTGRGLSYNDNDVGENEVFSSVGNMVIGFGLLTLPRSIIDVNPSTDGWMSIVIGGCVALFFTWVIVKLTTRFPRQGFFHLTASITNKPIAAILTLVFALYTMSFVSYEIRGVASISQLYLFDRTPVEVIGLVLLLVIIYAVAGPSTVLMRLNLMFLPIVLLIIFVVLVMNLGFFKMDNLKPVFNSSWIDIMKGSKETIFSFLGFEILLFYNAFITKKKIMKPALLGITVPILVYLIVFIFVVGVFGVQVVGSTLYPTAELAKQVEVPGGFFERFESIFFAIWVITLFNTASMALDVTLLAIESVFKKARRIILLFVLSPIIYIFVMQPQNIKEIATFGEWISYTGILCGMILPAVLLLLAKLRGVRGDG